MILAIEVASKVKNIVWPYSKAGSIDEIIASTMPEKFTMRIAERIRSATNQLMLFIDKSFSSRLGKALRAWLR